MIDLHNHTLFSDGALVPAELIQRHHALGNRAVAITDHVDPSNIDLVLPRVITACQQLNRHNRVQALAGVELTHVPPALIGPMIRQARDMGAQIVVVHGQTIVEPVPPGTNLAAIQAGADILAHPGLLTAEEAALAAARGVALEISARKGHCLTNGHVARLALAHGAALVINTDGHAPGDLIDRARARQVGLGAGLDEAQVQTAFENAARIATRAGLILA
ncbi:PHP domain protein [Desulfarculus baarsii DSM 2075]|uniref:PHP domain protein n=1 Tax=Desulfarculus baarsii (strain ATCC 33931 / DSM 2075 / LMG 7858 / VKM B-1802 / 2st14) TaxID=644282 RepID=E1QKD1_DESB2|nr:histidinol phosphate phosphatase domain-containing protein [Desulfarculus baarsii]ADK86024.1 PHP domain protein [Desulfarculus baarsii DSM 2075]